MFYMLYNRAFIESCREHKPITGTALNGSLDAKQWIPAGSHIRVYQEYLGEEIHGQNNLSRERM